MIYEEARVYLDNVSKYGSVLGLDTIRDLLGELGNPQDDLQFIHIAGTNGKGSILAYVSTILSEAGFVVGRYVSPTVVSYRERIQVDGGWIGEDELAALVEKVQKAVACMETSGRGCPTVFEIETAMAFLYFRDKKCDYVVLETGLGGRLDATNIIKNTVLAVFSTISRDHMEVLGGTLTEIAREKAGIIKPGCMVVSAAQRPEVRTVLEETAERYHCPFVFAEPENVCIMEETVRGQTFSYKEMQNLKIHLAGTCQIENAVTALEAVQALRTVRRKDNVTSKGAADKVAHKNAGVAVRIGCKKPEITDEAIRRGLARTVWVGRFTCIREQPLFIVDGAHNEDAARQLRKTLEAYFPGRRLIYLMGVFKDKEYEKIVEIMAPLATKVYTVNLPDKERTLDARMLKKAFDEVYGEEWRMAPEERVVAAIDAGRAEAAGDIGHVEAVGDIGHVVAVGDIGQAVRLALAEAGEEDVILAFGTLSYLGQVMELVNT